MKTEIASSHLLQFPVLFLKLLDPPGVTALEFYTNRQGGDRRISFLLKNHVQPGLDKKG